jgi:hypothetical protein
MAKNVLFSLSTPDFYLSFYGTLPSSGSYALRSFRGGIDEVITKSSQAKRIALKGLGSAFPLAQVQA